MSKKYKAVLFALDGDWVTDYRDCNSIEEVEEMLANQGSRWFFYPIPFVILDRGSLTTSHQRVISAPEGLEGCKGKTIGAISKVFKEDVENWQTALEEVLYQFK